MDVPTRSLAGKLDLLFRTDAAIAGGFAVAVCFVAYLLRDRAIRIPFCWPGSP